MKEGRKPEYPEKTPGDELLLLVVLHSPGSLVVEVSASGAAEPGSNPVFLLGIFLGPVTPVTAAFPASCLRQRSDW